MPAHLRSKSNHIVPQMAWLSEIGNQLRDEYTVVKQPDLYAGTAHRTA